MRFMIVFTMDPANMVEARGRFLATGAAPVEGVTMIGRWHGPGVGFVLAETTDSKALYRWVSEWTDLLSIEVFPVVEDADAAEVLGAIHGA